MVVPAWVVFLVLAAACAVSIAFPVVGAGIAAFGAFFTVVRLLVLGVHPLNDEIEFL